MKLQREDQTVQVRLKRLGVSILLVQNRDFVFICGEERVSVAVSGIEFLIECILLVGWQVC